MAATPLPTVETLRKLFDYCPETGILTHRTRVGTPRQCKRFNDAFAGKPAGGDNGEGYTRIRLSQFGQFKASRIIWKMVTGEEPDVIDHINGLRSDDRFENLRNVTFAENARNHARSKLNVSGRIGVHFDRRLSKWCAAIRNNGRSIDLGAYDNYTEAVIARRAAERAIGYHANHGRPQPCPWL